MIDLMVYAIACLILVAVMLAAVKIQSVIVRKRIEKEIYAQKMLEQKHAASKMQDIINHTWKFPVEQFYRECEKANATQLDNEFSQRKIKDFACARI